MNNDKKKTIVLAALGSVLLAVGAFQFIGGRGGGETPAPAPNPSPAAKKEEAPEPKTDSAKDELLALVSGSLPRRDPFQVQLSPEELMPKPPTPQPPASNPAPRRTGGGGSMIPPLTPMLGHLPAMSGDMGMGLPPGQPGSLPAVPSGPEYRVRGVIVGERPMAVFEDAGGNQRLVPLGGSVDGDTEVVGIERGRVTVRQRGQRKTLTISEESRED